MIYSVFVPEQGLYHYYETPNGVAFNADLPLPTLPADAGKIGVPSIDAARRLPSNAKLVGQGWHARGVLSAASSGVAGFGAFEPKSAVPLALALGAASAIQGYMMRRRGTPTIPPVVAGVGVFGVAMAVQWLIAPKD